MKIDNRTFAQERENLQNVYLPTILSSNFWKVMCSWAGGGHRVLAACQYRRADDGNDFKFTGISDIDICVFVETGLSFLPIVQIIELPLITEVCKFFLWISNRAYCLLPSPYSWGQLMLSCTRI